MTSMEISRLLYSHWSDMNFYFLPEIHTYRVLKSLTMPSLALLQSQLLLISEKLILTSERVSVKV